MCVWYVCLCVLNCFVAKGIEQRTYITEKQCFWLTLGFQMRGRKCQVYSVFLNSCFHFHVVAVKKLQPNNCHSISSLEIHSSSLEN